MASIPEMVVLLSSSVYRQKKAMYERFPNCKVYPLLLDWAQLSGEMIKEVNAVSCFLTPHSSLADHGCWTGR